MKIEDCWRQTAGLIFSISMLVIFGKAFYGRMYRVPGKFSVATEFLHLFFVPLFPLDSYLLFNERGGTAESVRVPMSVKSIVTAWFRSATGLTGFFTAWSLWLQSREQQPIDRTTAIWSITCCLLFVASYMPWYTRANATQAEKYTRRYEDARIPKVRIAHSPSATISRGFDVIPTASVAPVQPAEHEYRLFGTANDGSRMTYLVWAENEHAAKSRGEAFGIKVDRAELKTAEITDQ